MERAIKSFVFFAIPQICTVPFLFFVIVHVQGYYENIGASFRPFLIVIAVSRAIDVILDPLIGYCSDTNFGGYFGSSVLNRTRLQYVLIGNFLFSAALIFLFTPPTNSQLLYTTWFAFSYICFMIGYSVVYIPLTGLLLSLRHSKSKEDRLQNTIKR